MTPIELLYARNTIARHDETVQQELVFNLIVQNLAYHKDVEVLWTGEDAAQRSLKAQYVGPAGEHSEIWQAQATFQLTAEDSLPGDIQFVLHGRIGGVDYWNPPDRHGYAINADSGLRLGEKSPLVNVGFEPVLHPDHQFYPITIAVRQDLRPEEVVVRWTTNHWRTFADTPAFLWHKYWHHTIGSHARNPNRYGCGMWIGQLHLGDAFQVEYAICCKGRSRRYWDNHFGRNYLARHDRLKVLTLNLHCYQEDRQDEKLKQIAKAIRDLRIDLVCLQEVAEPWNHGQGDWNANAAKRIRDCLGEPYTIHTDWSHLGFGQYREGVAILSRHPLLAQDSRYVSSTQDVHDIHARRVVMVQTRVPYFGVVNVFCAHLSWWQNGFREQYENLRRWAESKQTPSVAATLLCGDFNNAAHTEGYGLVTREYEDQFLKANASYLNPADDHRIDYLLLQRGGSLCVRAAYPVFTPTYYGLVSDHVGYCAEFEPPA